MPPTKPPAESGTGHRNLDIKAAHRTNRAPYRQVYLPGRGPIRAVRARREATLPDGTENASRSKWRLRGVRAPYRQVYLPGRGPIRAVRARREATLPDGTENASRSKWRLRGVKAPPASLLAAEGPYSCGAGKTRSDELLVYSHASQATGWRMDVLVRGLPRTSVLASVLCELSTARPQGSRETSPNRTPPPGPVAGGHADSKLFALHLCYTSLVK